ncbi:MAG: trigger factor [Candidatus Eremiobacterota bacterium]
MQVTVNKLPGSRVLLNIEVETQKVTGAFNKAYDVLSRKTSIPGFRKGKVPRKILERAIGKDLISEEACNLLLAEAYTQAIKETDIFPLGEPELDVKKIEEGNPMVFTAEVDVKPLLSVPDYKSIQLEIEKDRYNVSDKQVEESLEVFKTQFAETKEIKDRGLQTGDFVDFTMNLTEFDSDGKEVKGDTNRKRAFFKEHAIDPSIMKEMGGMKVDETREFTITENEKKISYAVSLNSITEVQLPELTDEFLQKNTQFKSIDELKENFKKEWEHILADKKKGYIKENLFNKLVELIEKDGGIEIPLYLLNTKVTNLMNSHIVQLSQNHSSLDAYLTQSGITKEEYVEKLKEEATRSIKIDLVIDSIGSSEQINIPEEEVRNAVRKLEFFKDKGKSNKNLDKRDFEDYMKIQMRKQKIIDFLLNSINVIEN